MLIINQWLCKSTWITSASSCGTSSIQTCKLEERIARLASEWATILHCLRICEYLTSEKLEAKYRISWTMCPKWAKVCEPVLRALMRTWESPSKTTRVKPGSCARISALRAANASTSMTVEGRGMFWERDAMTYPSPFLITAHIPAQLSAWNKAPSKFTL